ncbi:Esterase [Dactylellina cionopaga]|nr:Esterase [Dactylellina cionopaga]
MPRLSKADTTQDGLMTTTHSTSYSLRARILYLVLKLLYSPIITHFLANPTESGHQHARIPKSVQKHFVIQRREFYDWTVYDISLKHDHDKNIKFRTEDGGQESKAKRRMMYIPGTGFTIPTSTEHFKFITKAFAAGLNAVVTVVLHPLAPKHTFADVYPKFFELYEQLVNDLPVDGEIDVGGDSSGGGISLSVVQHLGEKGLRLPDRLFLMAPSVDFVQPKEEDMKKVSKLDPLQRVDETHSVHVKWVDNAVELDDPKVSPIRGDFTCLERVKIVGLIGTYDILEPDTIRLREKLKGEGLQVDWLVGEKMLHCWPLLQLYIPEAKEAISWIIEKMK